MTDERPPLTLVWSAGVITAPVEDNDPKPDAAPEPVRRRRYTVTVRPDGSELLDEIEEWEE